MIAMNSLRQIVHQRNRCLAGVTEAMVHATNALATGGRGSVGHDISSLCFHIRPPRGQCECCGGRGGGLERLAPAQVAISLATSPEATDDVGDTYVTELGRAADSGGYAADVQYLARGGSVARKPGGCCAFLAAKLRRRRIAYSAGAGLPRPTAGGTRFYARAGANIRLLNMCERVCHRTHD